MATEQTMVLMEMGLVKALAHPLRQQILTILATPATPEAIEAAKEGSPGPDKDGLLPQSPNGLTTQLDEALGNVSYHLKTLLEYECVELVKTVPRRGAVEHFYTPTPKAKMRLMALASIGPELGAKNGAQDEKDGDHAE